MARINSLQNISVIHLICVICDKMRERLQVMRGETGVVASAEVRAGEEEREVGEPVIRLRGVVKEYPTAAGPFRALKGIDLDVRTGEFLGVVGKSGSGKTTLVNMLTGIDRLTRGDVRIAGTAVHELDENRLALWRGLHLGVIYQTFQLMPSLTLLDNVLLPMDFCGLYRGRRSVERALDLLDAVGLADHAHKLPSATSGGQQQRVAIARALANDPPVLVADEPTGRLDSITAGMIFDIFAGLVAKRKTIVMVTHDHSLARRMSRVIELEDGRVTANEG
jgi:putative ABC transport system ATP-binding protein